MKPSTRAGVMGGVLQILFTLPILLFYVLPPAMGALFAFFVCCIFLLIYPLPGVLLAHWTPAPRETGQIVRGSALSGLIAAGIDSLATLVMVLVVTLTGVNQRYLASLIPNANQIIEQSGMGFWFSTGGQLLQTGISLIFHIFAGTLLSILGAILYDAIRKN